MPASSGNLRAPNPFIRRVNQQNADARNDSRSRQYNALGVSYEQSAPRQNTRAFPPLFQGMGQPRPQSYQPPTQQWPQSYQPPTPISQRPQSYQSPTQPHQQPYQPPTPQRPQSYQPPTPQPPQPPQPSQQQPVSAAERFRRVNQGLPDGVMYEPLDENTMRQLNMSPAQQPPVRQGPVQPDIPQNLGQPDAQPFNNGADAIERLIQDERNANVFYSHLAEASPRGDFRIHLRNMAEASAERSGMYASMLSGLYGRAFTPAEARINTGLSFMDSVTLAMAEENKTLGVLTRFIEGLNDAGAVRTLQNIINRKIVEYNMLNFIRTHSDTRFTI